MKLLRFIAAMLLLPFIACAAVLVCIAVLGDSVGLAVGFAGVLIIGWHAEEIVCAIVGRPQ